MRLALRSARSLACSPADLRHVPAWMWSLARPASPLEAQCTWLPYSVTAFLTKKLTRASSVFEYGGGGSTVWFARRVQTLITVEHHPQWCDAIEDALRKAGLSNVTVVRREPDPVDGGGAPGAPHDNGYRSAASAGDFERYVRTIEAYPDDAFDVVLVDGRCRQACLRHARPKVRPGGLLILDDSDRARYRQAKELLGDWPRREFWGIRPFTRGPVHTTVWSRP